MNYIKIDLAELYDAVQILSIVKKLGILTYNYSFNDNEGRVIKYGVQYSCGRQPGERVYRQAANLNGWGKPLPYSSNGMSMRMVANDYEKLYSIPLDRSIVSVSIWDQTNTSLSLSEMRAKCERIETKLIENHIELFSCAPVGNNEKSTKLKVQKKRNSVIINEIFV